MDEAGKGSGRIGRLDYLRYGSYPRTLRTRLGRLEMRFLSAGKDGSARRLGSLLGRKPWRALWPGDGVLDRTSLPLRRPRPSTYHQKDLHLPILGVILLGLWVLDKWIL